MANSSYKRGEMQIDDHEETFTGFMRMSQYGGAAIVVTVLVPILMFGVNLGWFPSAVIATVLGIIMGVIMKFTGRYYAVLILSAVAFMLIMALVSLFGGADDDYQSDPVGVNAEATR